MDSLIGIYKRLRARRVCNVRLETVEISSNHLEIINVNRRSESKRKKIIIDRKTDNDIIQKSKNKAL